MLIIGIAFIFLVFMGLVVGLWLKGKAEGKESVSLPSPPVMFEPYLYITASDVEKLANIACIEQLDALIRQADIERKLPAFYEKYQILSKSCKEQYLENLLAIFTRGKESWLDSFMKKYTDISPQDILMMFMLEAGFDNKSIARMLMINYETLKKRKSRLKTKCKTSGVPFDFSRGNASLLRKPPIEV